MTRSISSVSIQPIDPHAGEDFYQVTVELPLSTVAFFTDLRNGLKIWGPYGTSSVAGISCEIFECFDETTEGEFSSNIYFEFMGAICGAERHADGITLRLSFAKQYDGLDRLDYTRTDLPDNCWIEPAHVIRKILGYTKH